MRPDTPSAGPAVAAPVLAATGLTRAVPLAAGGRRTLFAGVNIALAPGEVVAITGESGVGKSTLLNVIAGLDAPDAGEVLIGGKNVAALAEPDRARLRASALGFVFQAFHVLPHLSLARNVALPCLLAGMNAADALARAEATLAEVGLAGRGGDWPAVLSGGELQRVAIARALVHRPGLVLADEPTGNLDPETAGRILDLLLAQARDRRAAVLIVTHSEMVAAAADRVLRLSASGLLQA
ncbi:ABC transporter ATP-binding protein [Sandarakinorhabdus sp.]|jgi:putative ABC transport system ATP-binding protein|uniref:ABC transporter ATP-binding protein n=1 Tax=Sandarakinorhabdus sp. TaxID=1916663 RepID=UPI0028AD6194|nr:ABC transporter ATP-binding protein [Sandarakinorhabdus sp.]